METNERWKTWKQMMITWTKSKIFWPYPTNTYFCFWPSPRKHSIKKPCFVYFCFFLNSFRAFESFRGDSSSGLWLFSLGCGLFFECLRYFSQMMVWLHHGFYPDSAKLLNLLTLKFTIYEEKLFNSMTQLLILQSKFIEFTMPTKYTKLTNLIY